MAPNTDSLSAYAVAVAFAGAILGEKMGLLVGTYGVILLGWFIGLMYGLWVRPMDSKMPVWAYSLFTLGVTLFSTVTLAELSAKLMPWDVQWSSLLFPIAVAIPALPHKWGSIGEYLLGVWEAARRAKP